MSGYGAFFAKEWLEIQRTWRVWVIPGMLLFFGLTSPILALITPSLVSSLSGAQPGVTITIPPATALDAAAQFLKNLSQIVIFAVIISGAGSVSGERSSGTVILAVTKPVSRSALVGAKLSADLLLLLGATLAGTLICGVVTTGLFGTVPWRGLILSTAFWLTFATLVTCAVTFFSAWLRSRGAAAGAGLAFYFVTLLVSLWAPAVRHSFIGLPSLSATALSGASVAWVWPVVTALAAAAVFAFMSMEAFERQEL